MIRVAARGALIGLLVSLAAVQTFAQQDRGRRLFPPEELGVLEGPDRDAWQKPDLVMDALRVGEGSVVADVGAGGGWFTVRLARRVGPNGTVFAQDVQARWTPHSSSTRTTSSRIPSRCCRSSGRRSSRAGASAS